MQRFLKRVTSAESLFLLFIAMALIAVGTGIQTEGAQGKSGGHHDEDWDDDGHARR